MDFFCSTSANSDAAVRSCPLMVFALEGSTLLRQIAAGDGKVIGSSADAMVFLAERNWDVVAKRAADQCLSDWQQVWVERPS